MTSPIKELKPQVLIIPIGGKFDDSKYTFKKKRSDFHECMLMYKPDYFFQQYADDNDELVNIIKNNFNQFPWHELFILDIKKRIELQKQFFKIIDVPNTNDVKTKIQEFTVNSREKLLQKINEYRNPKQESIPWLISYKYLSKGQQRSMVWLIVKFRDYDLPKLDTFQQYKELFYFLNYLYTDQPQGLSIDFENLKINIDSTSIPASVTNQKKKVKVQRVEKSNKIYPAQEIVGDTIFKLIKSKIPDFENRYDRFEFCLLLPPRKSLEIQSLARMRTILDEFERDYLSTDITCLTYLVDQHRKNRFKCDVIDKATNPENKKTMYLIIQDECHWGMKLGSKADEYFINQETLLDVDRSNNIYILQVSATPYNIEAIKDFRRNNIIRWDEIVKDLGPTNYKGRIELIKENKIRCQSIQSKKCMFNFQNYYSSIGYLSANDVAGKISLPELSIVCEYIITLHYILASMPLFNNELKEFVTDETQEILRGLCDVDEDGKGYLAVLRLNNTETGQKLKEWLQRLLQLYNQPDLFDIVVDVDDDKNCLYDHLSKASQDKYKEWSNKLNGLTKEEKIDFGYDNLKYLPLLLIVIEKGRMGDTFPSESFRYFDLRARYQNDALKSTYYCSLLQDVGRSFGYPNPENDRPTVFMGQEIFDLLNQNQLDPHETLKKNDNMDENTDPNSMYVDLDQYWMPNKDHPFGPDAKLSRQEGHKNVAYRRFLLSAHPQIGKTASFLHAVHLFVDHFRKPTYEKINETQDTYFKILYDFRNQNSDELHNKLKDEQIQKQWDQFHVVANNIYDAWRKEPDEIVPVEHCIKMIKEAKEKFGKNDEMIVIDMGCGLAKLAENLRTEDKIKVFSIDHRRHPSISNDIHVIQMNMKNVTLKHIGNKLAHFVVFSLSLWGTEEDVTSYIQVATELLELNGSMIIIDAKNNKINNKNLKNEVISILNNTKKLSHQLSSKRLDSRFFCIKATRQEESDF